MRLAAFALLFSFSPIAWAGVFTPFRQALFDFKGGKIRALEKDVPRITGMNLSDEGRDVSYVELPPPNNALGPTRTYARFRAQFKREQWTLLLDGKPLEPVEKETGIYEIDVALKASETDFLLLAVGPRGEVEQEQRVFEAYDWDFYQKEKAAEGLTSHRDIELAGGFSLNFIAETYADIKTWTIAQTGLPELHGRMAWWKDRLPESRSWVWHLDAVLSYPLPLSGVLLLPTWMIGGGVQRRNLAAIQTATQRIPFKPGLKIRIEGISQGGLSQVVSDPSTLINSFTPRMTFFAWADLTLAVEFKVKTALFEVEPRFSRTIIGYSMLTSGINTFFPGGWGAGLRAIGSLPEWKKDWFAKLDFNFLGTLVTSAEGIGEYSVFLGVGKHFP